MTLCRKPLAHLPTVPLIHSKPHLPTDSSTHSSTRVQEKHFFDQLYGYLTTSHMLYELQSGIRPLHSTVTAQPDVTNDWFLNIDDGKFNMVLFKQ